MSEENKTVATEEEAKSAPLEKLPDLKSIREARGLKIEDIFLKTRINVAILNAIESGDFHLLPAPLYAKRFIESYAKTIGVDAETILVHYQRYLDKQAVPEEARGGKERTAIDRKPSKRLTMLAIPAVAIIAVAFIIFIFFPPGIDKPDEQKELTPKPAPAVKEQPSESVPQTPPSTVVDNVPPSPPVTNVPPSPPVTNVPPAPPPAPVNIPKTPPPAVTRNEAPQPPVKAGLNLLVEATEDTWLRVTVDQKPPFQTTLKAGQKMSRNAQEFFVIDVGNAAGVNITFQGKFIGNLGGKGEVVHLRLPQQ